MLSWLKKVGMIAGKGAAVVTGVDKVLPIIKAVAPKAAQDEIQAVEDTLPKIAAAIQDAEIIGAALNLPGTQKLTGATPLIAQVLLKSPLFKGKEPMDDAKFLAGCNKLADGMADILNSFGAEHVEAK